MRLYSTLSKLNYFFLSSKMNVYWCYETLEKTKSSFLFSTLNFLYLLCQISTNVERWPPPDEHILVPCYSKEHRWTWAKSRNAPSKAKKSFTDNEITVDHFACGHIEFSTVFLLRKWAFQSLVILQCSISAKVWLEICSHLTSTTQEKRYLPW